MKAMQRAWQRVSKPLCRPYTTDFGAKARYANPVSYSRAIAESVACVGSGRYRLFPLADIHLSQGPFVPTPRQTFDLTLQAACTPHAVGTGLALHAMADHLQCLDQTVIDPGHTEAALQTALVGRAQRLIAQAARIQNLLIAHTAMHPALMTLPEGPRAHRLLVGVIARHLVDILVQDQEVLVPLLSFCFGPGSEPEALAGHLGLAYLRVDSHNPGLCDVHLFDAAGFDAKSYDMQALLRQYNQSTSQDHPTLFTPHDLAPWARNVKTSPPTDRLFTHVQRTNKISYRSQLSGPTPLTYMLAKLLDQVTYANPLFPLDVPTSGPIQQSMTHSTDIRLGKGPHLYSELGPYTVPRQRLLPKQQGGECEHACLLPFLLHFFGIHRASLAQNVLTQFYQYTLCQAQLLAQRVRDEPKLGQNFVDQNDHDMGFHHKLHASIASLQKRIVESPLTLAGH